ncbi:MAG TPA: ABC transporter substrate binding protein [Burkholderiales bacterium]|nr:ABC transporter substrate binding protein [Burkholderiales bacterium]
MNPVVRIVLAAAAALALAGTAFAQQQARGEKPYRILYVMSYHSPMGWADGQFAGFKEALAGIPVEYRVFRMEANLHRNESWAVQKGKEARDLIEAWKPDLVYASDDDAQEHVTKHYVNKPLPIVVSGVNKDPAAYGLVGSRNVAGVLEPVHIVETVRLLQAVAPGVRRFGIVTDEAPSMQALVGQIREQIKAIPGVEIVAADTVRTFEAYQEVVRQYQDRVDAFWPLGVHGFVDAQGKGVPREVVLKWTAENSRLPDIAFWEDRVRLGTLVAVTVSPRQHGLAAGRMARAILVEGKSPASLGLKPDVKGVPMVSLARANKLGLKVTSGVLLSAEVLEKFEWEKR